LYSPCFGIKEETVEYAPVDRKVAYRKIPIAKKIVGDDFTIVSNADRNLS
jgi:hypothetical protein